MPGLTEASGLSFVVIVKGWVISPPEGLFTGEVMPQFLGEVTAQTWYWRA
jgi:hypothetical protein